MTGRVFVIISNWFLKHDDEFTVLRSQSNRAPLRWNGRVSSWMQTTHLQQLCDDVTMDQNLWGNVFSRRSDSSKVSSGCLCLVELWTVTLDSVGPSSSELQKHILKMSRKASFIQWSASVSVSPQRAEDWLCTNLTSSYSQFDSVQFYFIVPNPPVSKNGRQ